ncbi:MAG TPA: CbiX/SirB N-terminal domain-containing protein [Desulfuromonadales bacterium]|jgi:sirohydrochlorin cobaltochelatase|nr:CbiX/SirB N-terminal domain-containing protein [Desulfuromonadales bacterium]
MRTCLILLAHGSPDPRWRAPFEKLAATLKAEFGADRVKLAYLEYAAPSLEDVAGELAREGEGQCRLRILPLFMSGGGHVDRDIPGLVAALGWKYPEIAAEILPAAGEHPKVLAALREIAGEALRLPRNT